MGDWSQLPDCILKLVVQKLCFTDIIRTKLVCTSWFAKVDSYISLSDTHSAILMIPEGMEADESDKCFSFLCIGDKKIHELRNMPEDLVDGSCIGCSHGWLIFVDKYMNLCLYHPFAKARELLSSLEAFPYIHKIEHMYSHTYNIHHYCDEVGEVAGEVVHHEYTAQGLQDDFVKCVLSANPLHCDKFGLLVIHTIGCNLGDSDLAFYDSEDHQWTKIGAPPQRYYDDITHYNGRFYALRDKETVEVWDYDGSFPMKIRESNVHKFYRRILGIEQSFPFFM